MASTPTLLGKAVPYNLTIEQGATFDHTITRRQKPTVKRRIGGISRANPGKMTVVGHPFASGDRLYVSRLRGMAQADNRAYTITVVDPNSFTLGVDTSGYDAWVSGGQVDNGKPRDLTGYTARMDIRDKLTDTLVLSLTTENGRIILGGTAGTIRRLISATDTAALTLAEKEYDLELLDGLLAVRRLFQGAVTVSKERTHP